MIKVFCARRICRKELNEPGAVINLPPHHESSMTDPFVTVFKGHLCTVCAQDFMKWLQKNDGVKGQ